MEYLLNEHIGPIDDDDCIRRELKKTWATMKYLIRV